MQQKSLNSETCLCAKTWLCQSTLSFSVLTALGVEDMWCLLTSFDVCTSHFSLRMAKVHSTNHRLVLSCLNFGVTYFNGHIVCGVSCLSIVVHLSALYAMLYIQQVCTYKFREYYIGHKSPLLTV